MLLLFYHEIFVSDPENYWNQQGHEYGELECFIWDLKSCLKVFSNSKVT